MAHYNMAHVFGVVCDEPLVRKEDDGKVKSVSFSVATFASGMRSFDDSAGYPLDDICQVQVRCGDPKRAEALSHLRMFDIIYIKGTVNTRNVPKPLRCAECGEWFYAEKRRDKEEDKEDDSAETKEGQESTPGREDGSMITFVSPIVFDVRETKFGDEAKDLLKQQADGFFDETGNMDYERAEKCDARLEELQNESLKYVADIREFSNEVFLVGNLCADPVQWKDGDAPAASYQLGITRKFFLCDDAPSTRADYPYIRSYGKQGLADLAAIRKTSLVLVDGFLKRRWFRRESVCPHCGATKVWEGSTIETVPYAVEYLQNFKTEAELKEEESKEEEA